MDIVKLVGVALISLVIIIILKQNKPEFVIYVELIAGVIILTMAFNELGQVLNMIKDYSNKISINNKFIIILLKITGIAILSEFATTICKDAGETAIASKIEIATKIMIIATSIPIISSLLEVILQVLP